MLTINSLRTLAAAALTCSCLAAPAFPAPEGSSPIATEQIGGTTLSITPQVEYDSAILRVGGPGGFEAERSFDRGPIMLDLLATGRDGLLPDGKYRYEVFLTGSLGESRVHTGLFHAEVGRLVSREARQSRLAITRGELEQAADTAVATGDVLAAGGTHAQGSTAADGPSAQSLTVDDFLQINDTNENGFTSLHLRSFNNPPDDRDWSWENANGDLLLRSQLGGVVTKMVVTDSDRFGFGTTVPGSKLEVAGPAGILASIDAQLEITNTSSGGGSTEFRQTSSGLGIGHFVVSPLISFRNVAFISNDAPGSSLVIAGNGDIGLGTSSPAATLHVNGSGIIEGDVALGSSRTIKHEIENLDAAGVLAAIRELPVYGWKYRDDPTQAPHVGPMAEDVHQTFGVGRDEKHLSPADTAGLALAAIQGVDARLERDLDELRVQNTALAAENHVLCQRLEAIEKLIGDSLLSKENP